MISVIVSIYKRLDILDLIFLGLEQQTYKNFEVIVSEDNNAPEVVDFIDRMRVRFKFPIKHVSQEDIGFRKTRILNQAVLAASGDYLVFLDGDCIPHKRWLESYAKELTPNNVCMGRRCYIKEGFTHDILLSKDIRKLSFFNILFKCNHLDQAFYIPWDKPGNSSRLILGCNWGVFDWRLRQKKLDFLNIKRKLIVYHLYHQPNYNDSDTNQVNIQLEQKIKLGNMVCKNGIKKLN